MQKQLKKLLGVIFSFFLINAISLSFASDAPAVLDSEKAQLEQEEGRKKWDIHFGGIAEGKTDGYTKIGYPHFLDQYLSYGVNSHFGIGGRLAISTVNSVFLPRAHLGVPMRISLVNREKFSMVLNLEPSFDLIYFVIPGFGFETQLNFGGRIGKVVVLGGSLQIPMVGVLVGGVNSSVFLLSMPIQFGPILELKASSRISILLEALMGPQFLAAGLSTVTATGNPVSGAGIVGPLTAYKFELGLGYRF
jgi:uncharacterized membrane-anchored protein YitT (DUF2179 family)